MCGIWGWCGSTQVAPDEFVHRLSTLLHHRGPDDQGFEAGPGWGVGFRRLSILDLSPLGHQPMGTPDGRFWLVFNGEIYNYIELRTALEREGEQFKSGGDTEVLLCMLAREGPAALAKLNGMFALALIDTEQRTFLLARDRLGVKPLTYYQDAQQLRFASELKVLLAWPQAPREVDPAAVAEYLALNYLSTERSIFKGYQKLPPGHYLQGSLDAPGQARPMPYWHLTLNPEQGSQQLAERELEDLLALLTNAVQIRLRSDVPVGIFLSGGLDSGLVTALAATGTEGTRPLALTVGFHEQAYDESDLARATATQARLEHRIIVQRPSALDEVDRLAWFYDEPFGDISALPTFALCEAAATHATVFLSGDGGDEAFGGYRRYIQTQRYQWLAQLPALAGQGMQRVAELLPRFSPWRFRLAKSALPDAGFAAAFDTLPVDPVLAWVVHPSLRPLVATAGAPLWQRWAQSRGQSLTTRQQALDYAFYLPDDILVKMDRASMAHSIEVRSPFLDYRLVEWAAKLPRSALLNQTEGKLPLRTLGQRLLPQSVQRGEKRPFGVPLDEWFRAPTGQAFVRERLLSPTAQNYGFWDVAGVAELITAHQLPGNRNFGFLLWRLLMLESWARHYLDGTRFLDGPPQPGHQREGGYMAPTPATAVAAGVGGPGRVG